MIPKRNIVRNINKSLKQPLYALSVLSKRFKSSMTYSFRNGYSAYPETISMFLTYRCNLRCKMCGQWGESGSSHSYSEEKLETQLTLETIEKLLDNVMDFKPNITLFGGEPLLYRDWPVVVKMVKKRGMRCNVITNGVLVKQQARNIIDAGIDEIIFSLDGPKDVHDKIRGTAGTYDRAMAGFKQLQELKATKGVKAPLINISTTIFEANYERLDEVVDSAVEMSAASLTFHHLIFLGEETYLRHENIFGKHFSGSSNDCDWKGFVKEQLPAIVPEKLIPILKKIKTARTDIDISVYPNLTEDEVKKYYTSFDFLPDSYSKKCLSPWMTAYVLPDGSVRPCQSLNYSIGNILENSFKEIWNSSAALKFRRVLKEEKHFPVCSRCTEFYRA